MSYIQNPYFFPIEPFNGSNNFRRWKERVLLRLRTLNIAYVLTEQRPSENHPEERKDWEHDDSLCRGHILETLTDRLFDLHRHRNTGKTLWDSLERTHGIEDLVSKCSAYERYTDFKMAVDKPILEQMCKFESIVDDLASQGVKFDEKHNVRTIIRNLTLPSWEDHRYLLIRKYDDDPTMDQLWDSVRREEMLRRYKKEKAMRSSCNTDKLAVRKRIRKRARGKPGHFAPY